MAKIRLVLRKLTKLLSILVAVCAIICISLPAWLPWVLRPLLARWGLHYATYERLGYNRFALDEVRWSRANVSLRARRVEALLPARWLWSRFFEKDPAVQLTVSEWTLANEPGKGTRTTSLAATLDRLPAAVLVAKAWSPGFVLTNGVIQFGAELLKVERVEFDSKEFSVRLRTDRLAETLDARARLTSDPRRYDLTLRLEPADVTVKADLFQQPGWQIAGHLQWRGNRAEFQADLAGDNWLPKAATLDAPELRLPAKMLHLDGYSDPAAAFHGRWTNSTFQVQFSSQAVATNEFYPPVSVDITARGDLKTLVVDQMNIQMPWLEARLIDPINSQHDAKPLVIHGRFATRFDLGKLPAANLNGILQGEAHVEVGDNLLPQLNFALDGTELCVLNQQLAAVHATGSLFWPMLEISDVQLFPGDGSVLTGGGQVDLAERYVVAAAWETAGPWIRRFLPTGWTYSSMEASGRLSGVVNNLEHTGHVRAQQVDGPDVKPVDLALDWVGRQSKLESVTAQLKAGDAAISTQAAITWRPSISVSLRSLTWRRGDELFGSLQQPATLTIDSAGAVQIEGLHLRGGDRELVAAGALDWPRRGRGTLSVRNMSPVDFSDFLEKAPPNATLSVFTFAGKWDDGPLDFEAELQSSTVIAEDRPISITAKLRGGADGIQVGSFNIANPTGKVLSAEGRLPLNIYPARGTNAVQVIENKPLNLHAQTAPNVFFWERVGKLVHTRLEEPSATVDLHGTMEAPAGTVRMSAKAVNIDAPDTTWPLPKIENLTAELVVDADAIRCQRLDWEIESQPVHLTGRLPMRKDNWDALFTKGELPDWRRATGHIVVTNAAVGAFQRYLPSELRSQGLINVDLALSAGMRLNGILTLTNAATRPLLTLGPIRDLTARVRFAERTAKIEEFSGQLGNEPVMLTGQVELTDEGRALFDLALQAENVPLVRGPGLVIRSDLALHLNRQGTKPPTISGEMRLRDSLYLKDLQLLAPKQVTSPTMRPPYIRVEEPPFADWNLNLRITGDQFLQVRSPIFRGKVSAGLTLTGSLREPQAIGEVSVHSGRITLPFADLDVDHGWITLRKEKPHEPEMMITASGSTFGYDITMFVTGTADNPQITFASMPPLDSEQILLMLTAGELPHGEYTFTAQQRASTLILYLGREMLSRLGSDEVTADRLSIRTGEDVAEQGNLTYSLEYRLNKRFSVVGEYDRFNALNAGIKFKLLGR